MKDVVLFHGKITHVLSAVRVYMTRCNAARNALNGEDAYLNIFVPLYAWFKHSS
jgi:hypothetical protein